MKRKLLLILALVMCLSCIVTACDEEKKEPTYSQGLSFINLPDGTCAVNGLGTCEDTEINIPPTSPEGKKVTAIDGYAFQDKTELTAVIMPNSVTEIGPYAFAGCSGITSIIFPDGMEKVGIYAFTRCEGLKQLYLGSSLVSVADGAFFGCSTLQYVFFRGGKAAWEKVHVGSGNSAASLDGILYLYSATPPTESGSYWYYSGGSFCLW